MTGTRRPTPGVPPTEEAPRAPAAPGEGDPHRTAVSVGLLVATGVCVAVVEAAWHSPIRTVAALGFVLVVPGLAVAELLGVRDPMQRLAIAIGASLAVETLVALTLLYAGAYSSRLTLVIVAAVTTLAVLATLVRGPRPGRPGPP